MSHPSPAHAVSSRPVCGRRLPLLLLSVALIGCGRQASTPTAATSDPVQLEAENGTVTPLAPQDIAEPRTGGKIIRDPGASGGQAVILLSNHDAVKFKLPANFTPGRYTVKVQARGEEYRGWPTVALENDRRGHMSVTTVDTRTYAPRGFGQFDLRPNQEMYVSFTNDLYDGPGKDCNVVVDYLLIEPVKVTPAPPPARPYAVQFGSRDTDVGNGVAVDAGENAYVVGVTYGTLPGQVDVGDQDAFIRKTNAQGQEVWTRQFGTANRPYAYAVAVDAVGNSYVGGYAERPFPGQTQQGYTDAFLRKYSPDGTVLWTRQFGTPQEDSVYGLTVDAAGNIYAVGTLGAPHLGAGGVPNPGEPPSNADVFLRRYTPDGTLVWARQFGTDQYDGAGSVSVDAAGNVFVAGTTQGAFPGFKYGVQDAFVSKFTASGEPVWTQQFGSVANNQYTESLDGASSVRVDRAGNVYVAGFVGGSLAGQTSVGRTDAFVRKLGTDGKELWARQVGDSTVNGSGFKTVNSFGYLDLDATGNVYLTVTTNGGNRAGMTTLESVLKYAPNGTLLRTLPLGIPGASLSDMAVGRSGSVFLTGRIDGTLPGTTSAGGGDVFLIKLVP